MRNTSKATATRNRPASVDYAEAVTLAKAAGTRFKAFERKTERDGLAVVTLCAKATGEAVSSGYLHLDPKSPKADNTVNRAEYGRKFYGLTNGSLVTFWCTLADALNKGVESDSSLFRVLAGGRNPIGRRGGMAEAIRKATDRNGVENAVRAAGFNPETGGKVQSSATHTRGVTAGAKPTDPVTACAEAVKVLRANLPKLPKGYSPEWLKVRKAILDAVQAQEKARPKPADPKPAATLAATG